MSGSPVIFQFFHFPSVPAELSLVITTKDIVNTLFIGLRKDGLAVHLPEAGLLILQDL